MNDATSLGQIAPKCPDSHLMGPLTDRHLSYGRSSVNARPHSVSPPIGSSCRIQRSRDSVGDVMARDASAAQKSAVTGAASGVRLARAIGDDV